MSLNIRTEIMASSSSNTSHELLTTKSSSDIRKYELDDFVPLITLGTGTFGRVYLAQEKTTREFFALKVLKKAEVVRLKQVEHVGNERSILDSIHHPFIVNMLCSFQDNDNLYMCLEYVCGGELFSHLRRAGRFTNEMTRFYGGEIILALEYLHSLHIVYRDLKPENLLLSQTGHLKITDFGFSKRVRDKTYTLCGTPEYLAPEIIQNKGHGKAVDWWALGVLLYEMLAGYPPFYASNPFAIYELILAGDVQFPGHMDAQAQDIIKRLLTADRTRRIGCLKNGAEDLKKHRWYRGVDWTVVFNQQTKAPIVPVVTFPGDTRNFERYPEPTEPISPKTEENSFGDLFIDF